MKITVCMIVKNEESVLENCLKNIKKYVDEIVIVDTGSMDNTKNIAKSYTDYVYDFEWCNDFSKARDYAISKATNDWILTLDADEVVKEFDIKTVLKFVKKDEKVVGRIKRINTFEDLNETKRYIERVNRLFNRKYFEYEGIIHEQIVLKDNKNYKTQNVDIILDHIGYTKEVINRTNKIDRNINLLKEALKNNMNDLYLHYQLGKSYYMAKDYENASKYLSNALKLDIDFKYEYVEDLVESFGYALINSGKFKDALIIGGYNEYYKNSPDYNFLMGLIYMNNAMFAEAVNSFQLCIGKKEGKIEGINSYQPNYNIGVIYECLGYTEEAARFYKLCGNYKLAKERLNKIR